jgi:uncharacterized protein
MKCPICKAEVDEKPAGEAAKYFPFCSDQCRLIDLGRWLDGKYQIPADDESAIPRDDRDERDDLSAAGL